MVSCVPLSDLSNRFGDVGIRAATANVPAHPLAQLLGRQLWSCSQIGGRMTRNARVDFTEHRHGGTDLPWGAVATLITIMLHEGRLQWVQLVRRAQSLDGRDALTLMHHGQRQT